MKQKILRARNLAVSVAFMASALVGQFAFVQFAHAVSADTWVGTAGDNKFSTASNWVGGVVPSNGDTLAFSVAGLNTFTTLHNDLTNLSVAGITVSGQSADGSYAIDGNTITTTGNLTSTATDGEHATTTSLATNLILGADITAQNFSIGGTGTTLDTQGHSISAGVTDSCIGLPKLLGSGNVQVTAGSVALNKDSTTYTGNITVSGGSAVASVGSLGTADGTTTVSGSGALFLYAGANSSWSEPFVLGGSGSIALQHSSQNGCSGGDDSEVFTGTFTGPVSLTSDFKYTGSDNMTVTGTYTSNGHTFATAAGAGGTLTTPEGTSTAPVDSQTYSDSQPDTFVNLGTNQTAIIDGARGDVNVNAGGTLMGTGTIKSLGLVGGTVSPGHSPGTLTILTSFTAIEGGTYKAELKDASAGGYDQLKVSDPSRTTGNDIFIDTSTNLAVSLYDGYSIKTGDKFTIIDDQQPSTQLVQGTFNGLAEGAQLTVGNITFSITYTGGDGNDVVLTALNTGSDPSAPNTGIKNFVTANPAVVAGLGIIVAGALMTLAIRRRATK